MAHRDWPNQDRSLLRPSFIKTHGENSADKRNGLPCTVWCHGVIHDIHGLSRHFNTVFAGLSCLKNTKFQQGIHRHQTPPRYRHAALGSHCNVQPQRFVIRSLQPNVMSSIRAEVTPPEEDRAKATGDLHRLGLSHWDPYAVHRGGCLELYYCNMVEWFW